MSSILKTSTRKERDKSCSGDAETIPRKNLKLTAIGGNSCPNFKNEKKVFFTSKSEILENKKITGILKIDSRLDGEGNFKQDGGKDFFVKTVLTPIEEKLTNHKNTPKIPPILGNALTTPTDMKPLPNITNDLNPEPKLHSNDKTLPYSATKPPPEEIIDLTDTPPKPHQTSTDRQPSPCPLIHPGLGIDDANTCLQEKNHQQQCH